MKEIVELKKLANAINDAPIGMVTLTIKGKFKTVNKAFCKIIGYTAKELLTKNISQFTHPDDKHIGYKVIEELTVGKKNKTNFEKRYVHKNGNIIYAQVSTVMVRDKLGTPKNFFTQVIDITTQKKYERDLKESEQNFRVLVESARDAIIVVQNDVIKFANPHAGELYGASISNFVGQPFIKFIHPDSIEMIQKRYADWRSGKKVPNFYKMDLINSKKEKRICEINASTIVFDGQPSELVIIHDITERRRMEERLINSEQKFRVLTENTPVGIYYIDLNGTFIYGNKKAEKIIGYKSDELIGKNFLKLKLLNPKDIMKGAKLLGLNLLGKSTGPDSFTLNRKDGTQRQVEIWTEVIHIKGKKVVLGMVQDITKRIQAEKELKESEEKFRNFVETSADLVIRLNKTGYIDYVSPRVSNLYGYKPNELIGKHLKYTTPSKDIPNAMIAIKTLLSGKPLMNFEIDQKSKTGKIIPMEINAVPIKKDRKIVGFQGIMRDISERKEAIENLKKSEEKYRSLSKELLTSNSMKELLLDVISHDLKNPAAVIKGFAKIGRENNPNNEILKEIDGGIDNLLNVIGNATILSKVTIGDEIEKEELDLTDMINTIIKEYSPHLQYEKMTIDMKIEEELIVTANPIIGEVFRNYISNTIRYAKTGKKIIIYAIVEDRYVTVKFKDFGKTIEKKDRENIFIRNVKLGKTKGRGLGLAIVKRIAEAHSAEVGVKPNKPKGNIFYIKLPVL